jgi:uncharacterized membrane protein YccC
MLFIKNLWGKFYKKYIYSFDPLSTNLKNTFKTLLSLLITFIIFYSFFRDYLLWALLPTFFISQIKVGNNMSSRRMNMLISILIIIILTPISTISGNSLIVSVSWIMILTFIAFFVTVINQTYSLMGMMILLAVVIPINLPGSFEQGIYRSLSAATGGLISFIIFYLILPIRPKIILNTILGTALDDISDFLNINIGDKEAKGLNFKEINFRKDRALDAIKRLRQFPVMFNLAPRQEGGPIASITAFSESLERIIDDITAMYMSFDLNEEERQRLATIHSQLSQLHNKTKKKFYDWVKAIKKKEKLPDFIQLNEEIETIQKKLIDLRKSKPKGFPKSSWLKVLHALYALKSLVRELSHAYDNCKRSLSFSKDEVIKINLKKVIEKVKNNLNFKSEIFRYSIRVAIAAAIAMFISKYFHIDKGIWIVIFVIIIVKSNLGNSIKTGVLRLLGTIIGAGLSTGFVFLTGIHSPVFYTFMIISFFLMIFLIQSPYYLTKTIVITFCVLLIYFLLVSENFELSLIRVYNTAVAVALGLIVSYFFWPNKSGNKLRSVIADNFTIEAKYLKTISESFLSDGEKNILISDRNKLENSLKNTGNIFKAAMAEPRKSVVNKEEIYTLLLHQIRIQQILDEIANLNKQPSGEEFRNKIIECLQTFYKQSIQSLEIFENTIRSKSKPKPIPDLSQSIENIRTRIKELDKSGLVATQPIDNILHLSSYLGDLQKLALEINETNKHINRLYNL